MMGNRVRSTTMLPMEQPDMHTFPASQALQVVEAVKQWGVAPESLLGPLGLTEQVLLEPGHRLSVDTMMAVFRRGRALTGEPGLGVYIGLRRRISMYGFLGMATMTAANVREALEVVVEFSRSVSTAISLTLRESERLAALVVEQHVDLEDVADVAAFAFFVGYMQISAFLTGRDPVTEGGKELTIDMEIPEPEYFSRFAHLLPRVRFEQPVGQVVMSSSILDLPLLMPDRAALNLARRQCEEELRVLNVQGTLAGQIRRVLAGPDGLRTVTEVAANLHMSTRTLKRRLAAHGTTFTKLREQEACQRAMHLLRDPELSLDDIAVRLGYSTLSNFARAFQRWTAQTPAAYRRGLTS